ncbi:MAG: hypothetical protein JW953_01405 [Anaerolineae bacterium]|nr:hypothetical protein [Anaerolineae bacterium]
MNKINAARQALGLIELENASAGPVKQAIEQVSQITAVEGNQVNFAGRRIVEGHGFALTVNCYDIYRCPRGYLLHVYMDKGPNWAVAGKTLAGMLAAAPDQTVARRAHGELVKKGFISIHDRGGS